MIWNVDTHIYYLLNAIEVISFNWGAAMRRLYNKWGMNTKLKQNDTIRKIVS